MYCIVDFIGVFIVFRVSVMFPPFIVITPSIQLMFLIVDPKRADPLSLIVTKCVFQLGIH